MLLSIAAGPAFIAFVRRHALGQQIREEGPAGHMSKQGTPTMGGLILLSCALLTFAVLTKRTTPALTVAGVTIACAAIGFVDDWFKLAHRRSLGLSGRWKMLALLGVTAALGYVAHQPAPVHRRLPARCSTSGWTSARPTTCCCSWSSPAAPTRST